MTLGSMSYHPFPIPAGSSIWKDGTKLCGVLLLVGLVGCQDAKKQAMLELERRGVAATPAALVEAVRQNSATLIGFLGAAGVKAGLPSDGEPTVLHLAVLQQDWLLVARLLDFSDKAVINHPGPSRIVVLEQALLAGQSGVAMALLEAGAEPDRAVESVDLLLRRTAPDAALVDRLILALPRGHESLGPALLRAVAAGEDGRVQRLLKRGAPPGFKSAQSRNNTLELASQGGFTAIAGQLILAGALPEESPAALGYAVDRRDVAMAGLLLEAGALPGAVADSAGRGETPFAQALEARHMELIRLMLKHGASPAFGLDHALIHGDLDLLDLLLQQGLPVDQPGPDGNPPLVRAAVAGHDGLIRRLLEKGASPGQPGALGQTAYHMAVLHRKVNVVDTLLAAGARPDDPFRKPAPPELIPLFGSEYFAKWYQRDEGLTPLMLAAARGDTAQLRQLLKGGARRGAQTKAWHRYAIVFACDCVQIPAAQILLGRDPDTETDRQHAVVSLSRQRVTLFRNDQPVRSARVSTGKQSTPTPAGKYIITDKQADWVSSIYKVSMPFFMRLSCKEIGFHAGMVPGYPASHGCIRMPKGDVQAFFKLLKIGDPVTIEP